MCERIYLGKHIPHIHACKYLRKKWACLCAGEHGGRGKNQVKSPQGQGEAISTSSREQ